MGNVEELNMERFFNTAGPVNEDWHYCVPPLTRLNLKYVLRLINQQKYFVLHAPRQTGKTSFLLALMEYLKQAGRYHALYVNVEVAQTAREDVKAGIKAILSRFASMANIYLEDAFIKHSWQDVLQENGGHAALQEMLTLWAKHSKKPLVLFIDEIDSLVGDTLISVLRQLRAGYTQRPTHFPQSIILCGVRDVRDYRIYSDKHKSMITGGSAFNIKAKSLRVGNFDQTEINELYQQHTVETGQVFEKDVLDLVWQLTQGQPWLVNALGYEVTYELEHEDDRSIPITQAMIMQAKENLILRRETHLDQLVDKLKEKRVRDVIEPMLSGEGDPESLNEDDVLYVKDLGLIDNVGQLRIANRIYQEVIPRTLTYTTQLTIAHQPTWYIQKDGQIDMPKLLTAFQQFFREHSEHWIERFDYKEAGPQLLLQAFLQRIVNSGGRVEREYGLGRKRTDLLIIWHYHDKIQRVVLELKILRSSLKKTMAEGLKQTWDYMDKCGTDDGHLVIFNRDEDVSWDEKIFQQDAICQDKKIMIWGM